MAQQRPWERAQRSAVWPLLLYAQAALGFSLSRVDRNACESDGVTYGLGEWYMIHVCTHCECTSSGPSCMSESCVIPSGCLHLVRYPTECCARCEKFGCEYRGEVYDLNRDFQPSECEQCTCDGDGFVHCQVADCAPPPCVNPVNETGQCCPQCKEGPNCYVDETHTHVIPAGESVWVDTCTKCRCHDSQDPSSWRGNLQATCSRLENCIPEPL